MLFLPEPIFSAFVLIYYTSINLACLILFAWDKAASRQKKARVAERVFLLIIIIGGCIGALAGQQLFRHKTRKLHFTGTIWLSIALHIMINLTLMS